MTLRPPPADLPVRRMLFGGASPYPAADASAVHWGTIRHQIEESSLSSDEEAQAALQEAEEAYARSRIAGDGERRDWLEEALDAAWFLRGRLERGGLQGATVAKLVRNVQNHLRRDIFFNGWRLAQESPDDPSPVVEVYFTPRLEFTGERMNRQGHSYWKVVVNGERENLQDLPDGSFRALIAMRKGLKVHKDQLSRLRKWLQARGLPRDLECLHVEGV